MRCVLTAHRLAHVLAGDLGALPIPFYGEQKLEPGRRVGADSAKARRPFTSPGFACRRMVARIFTLRGAWEAVDDSRHSGRRPTFGRGPPPHPRNCPRAWGCAGLFNYSGVWGGAEKRRLPS